MRILYLSAHSVLEWMEILLFRSLGHYVFSPGAYCEPRNVGDTSLRPGIDMDYDQGDKEAWSKVTNSTPPGEDGKDHLTKEFVDRFDCVVVMHIPRWIINNWEAMKHKPVIWRTIGQSISAREAELKPYREKGLKIVRYSPREERIPGYIGQDAMIRFYIDTDEFSGWTGEELNVITFGQSMHKRGPACNFVFWHDVTSPFNRKLFGTETEEIIPYGKGKVSFDELKRQMRVNRVYFYTGTHPASVTLNFLEASSTGIPLVCIGPEHGNGKYFGSGHDLYEIPDLIHNGVNGFVSDDKRELRQYISDLMYDKDLAKKIGSAGREMAIRTFGKEPIKEQWRQYLATLS